MASRDLHNNISAVLAVDPFIATVDGTTNGNVVDLQGYESCTFVWTAGSVVAGSIAINVQHGDQANGSDMADVAAAELLGTEQTFDSADDNAVGKVSYRGNKRYVRAQIVVTNAVTGADHVVAFALRGHPRHAPVSA